MFLKIFRPSKNTHWFSNVIFLNIFYNILSNKVATSFYVVLCRLMGLYLEIYVGLSNFGIKVMNIFLVLFLSPHF